MIKIEFSMAVALYLFLAVFLVLIFWAVSEKRKTLKPFSLESRFFWQCDICTYVYVDSMHNAISQCPRCGSYNKKSNESA